MDSSMAGQGGLSIAAPLGLEPATAAGGATPVGGEPADDPADVHTPGAKRGAVERAAGSTAAVVVRRDEDAGARGAGSGDVDRAKSGGRKRKVAVRRGEAEDSHRRSGATSPASTSGHSTASSHTSTATTKNKGGRPAKKCPNPKHANGCTNGPHCKCPGFDGCAHAGPGECESTHNVRFRTFCNPCLAAKRRAKKEQTKKAKAAAALKAQEDAARATPLGAAPASSSVVYMPAATMHPSLMARGGALPGGYVGTVPVLDPASGAAGVRISSATAAASDAVLAQAGLASFLDEPVAPVPTPAAPSFGTGAFGDSPGESPLSTEVPYGTELNMAQLEALAFEGLDGIDELEPLDVAGDCAVTIDEDWRVVDPASGTVVWKDGSKPEGASAAGAQISAGPPPGTSAAAPGASPKPAPSAPPAPPVRAASGEEPPVAASPHTSATPLRAAPLSPAHPPDSATVDLAAAGASSQVVAPSAPPAIPPRRASSGVSTPSRGHTGDSAGSYKAPSGDMLSTYSGGASAGRTAADSSASASSTTSLNRAAVTPPADQKSTAVAYMLWLVGFTGAPHFYLGRTTFGLVYLCTFGMLGVGWLADLFRLSTLVRMHNQGYDVRSDCHAPGKHPAVVRDRMVTDARLLCMPLGLFGAHRFYMRQRKWGFLYACTFGLLGIGPIFDFVRMRALIHRQVVESSLPAGRDVKHLDDAYLMWFPFGIIGAHHFYLGRTRWGFLYMFTFGLLGMGFLLDCFRMRALVTRANGGIPATGKSGERAVYLDDCYVLALPFGLLGFHHFYLGRTKWGVLYACTLGFLGLGVVWDLVFMKSLVNKGHSGGLGFGEPIMYSTYDNADSGVTRARGPSVPASRA